jgi:hypothetical protein
VCLDYNVGDDVPLLQDLFSSSSRRHHSKIPLLTRQQLPTQAKGRGVADVVGEF